MRFRCAICGETHAGMPAIGFAFPIQVMDVAEAERKRRVRLDGDLCVIDGRQFFVRGGLAIPVQGSRTPFVWGLWVRVSRASFKTFEKLRGATKRSQHGPFRGRLSSPPRPYPDSLDLAATVHLRDRGERAAVELAASSHPLAVEQRNGISKARVAEICTMMRHGAILGRRVK